MVERIIKPNHSHQLIMNDLKKTLLNYQEVPLDEKLALVSQFLGMLIGIQDQSKRSPENIMKIVQSNIEIGNQQLINVMFEGISEKPNG